MATLLKERARKPLVDGAGCYTSEGHNGGSPLFRLTMFHKSDPDYEVVLTRSEMLETVSAWLKIEATHAQRKEKAEQKERELAAQVSS